MRPEGCEADLLRALASMPFLNRLEIVAVTGWSRGAVYEAVEKLESGGLCASVLHATELLPQARRFHLTAAGLRRLADEEDRPLEGLLRERPVSAQWRRSLMERLDAVASVYSVASAVSGVAYPIRFHWYRASPLDAAMALPDGKTVGIVRQGLTADRSGFAKRLWRLRDGPMPGALLVLMADAVRLRHARRLLSTTEAPALFALEREAVLAEADDPIWRPLKVSAAVDLRYYSSHRPLDDHGTRPAVLVVFEDEIAQTHFLRVAREEMRAEQVTVPLWVSHREAIDALGPLGSAWRTPGEWESTQTLPPR